MILAISGCERGTRAPPTALASEIRGEGRCRKQLFEWLAIRLFERALVSFSALRVIIYNLQLAALTGSARGGEANGSRAPGAARRRTVYGEQHLRLGYL